MSTSKEGGLFDVYICFVLIPPVLVTMALQRLSLCREAQVQNLSVSHWPQTQCLLLREKR